MNKYKLEELRSRNFFDKKNNFNEFRNIKSKLVCGKYSSRIPEVTIIMPTYKRPDTIKDAIESILNQDEFYDFEIVIVDNESIFDKETETEKIVKSFENEKIIYYKNEENIGMFGNWNRCIELSRTKWICMVHDDDALVRNHLKEMMEIIKLNNNIKFLSCNHLSMDERNEVIDINKYIKSNMDTNIKITKLDYKDYNLGFKSPLLGAIFDRQKAIEIGGFEVNQSYIEDYFFVAKFAYYYKTYAIDKKLYVYRWAQNLSLKGSIWQESSIYEYYLYKYISEKRSILTKKLYDALSKYYILDRIKRYKDGTSFLKQKCDIDEDFVVACLQFNSKDINPIILNIAKVYKKIEDKVKVIFNTKKVVGD